jgi:hypothetical protein
MYAAFAMDALRRVGRGARELLDAFLPFSMGTALQAELVRTIDVVPDVDLLRPFAPACPVSWA